MEAEETIIRLEPGNDFVITPFIESICQRSLSYLKAGYPVHLSGTAGTGKTTLAMHLAGMLGRPVAIIFGDEEFGSSDLIGSEKGFVSNKLVDNYVHSVLKTEENVKSLWVDQRLTTACKDGYTLVYDEFSRSHAEANNVLLSVLEEKLIVLPGGRYDESYIPVHPEFRAIFTSNPDEYAGVYTPQSALLDRMITIKLGCYDFDTEVAITAAKSGLLPEEARKIVEVVSAVRKEPGNISPPTVRASIIIARILYHCQEKPELGNRVFMETCMDVLYNGVNNNGKFHKIIETVFNEQSSVIQ
jgi:nitric oxide reductase NorQ protein